MGKKKAKLLLPILYISILSQISVSTLCFATQNDAIQPITEAPITNENKVTLGKDLFNDPLFSRDKTLSCASCHSLNKGGTDNLARYIGLDKREGQFNTPTIFNSSLNFKQFWDARASTLGEAIDDHVASSTIFGNTWADIVHRVKENSAYTTAFAHIYKKEINQHTIKDALTAYINTLSTPHSPFDRFLQGDTKALSNDAQKGYQLFKKYGCITCHQGPNMGGNLIMRLGIYKEYYPTQKTPTTADLGLFNITGKEEDKYAFKVPTLRNIALTAPYLHDGSIKTLDEVIKIMGVYQVGQPIPNSDIPYIVKFLESLTW